MSDRPSSTIPQGASVTINIPPGWFTYISGLSRNSFAQAIRLSVSNPTNTARPNKESFIHDPTKRVQANEVMKLDRGGNSYNIGARNDAQTIELTAYYSMDPKATVSDLGAEPGDYKDVVKGLRICQAATPERLREEMPDYVTFLVFVQASADQKATDSAPLYNDAVCTINMIKGTRFNHDGVPMPYEGKGPQGAANNGLTNMEITKNIHALAPAKVIAPPTNQDPVKNSFTINIPAGWHGFVTGLSRAKYNQTIKINYVKGRTNNLEYLIAQSGETDDTMRLERDKGDDFYGFVATDKDVVLTFSFLWSKDNVSGSQLDDQQGQYKSQKLKVAKTQTPPTSVKFFPDYVTYFIMAEDQTEADQVAGVPEFNDCVGLVYLVKDTLMVFNNQV